jgi:hypothetical protein
MNHALVRLARTIVWSFLEERFGAVYEDKPARPPLPTRFRSKIASGIQPVQDSRANSGPLDVKLN